LRILFGKTPEIKVKKRKWETKALQDFQQFTGNTITNITDFAKEIEKIRTKGFSVDHEEYEEGVKCVGAPLLIKKKEIIGAIAVTGPRTRLPDDRIIPLSKAVIKCAKACRQKANGNLLRVSRDNVP